jgi:DNA-binding NarL/FixJ family response regulator
MTEVSVLVVDEMPVVRGGLRALLASTPGVRVVATAGSTSDAVRQTLLHRPDVLVLDRIRAIEHVLRSAPGTAVLVFSGRSDRESVTAALRAGARGYLHKDAAPEDIVRAIHGVAGGGLIFGATIADRLPELLAGPASYPFAELTTREREVLDLVVRGLPNLAVARRLSLAPKTISNHISVICAKLGVPDRTAVIMRAQAALRGPVNVTA